MMSAARSILVMTLTALVVGLLPGQASAYEVQPGDTASEIAATHQLSLARLVRLNHLPAGGALIRAGEHLRLHARPHPRAHDRRHAHQRHQRHQRLNHLRHHRRYDPRQTVVRGTVSRTAHRRGVGRHLALAIAWQESGWQQDVRSSAGALGIMQVLPSTGRWVSRALVGRSLDIRRAHDNVVAGVTYLDWLLDHARMRRRAIGGYYQGLRSVREHQLYAGTRAYVRSVRALRARSRHGGILR